MRYKVNWTAELVERMMTLHRKGLTTGEIAREFGVTRNSICGKLHREKIKRGERYFKPRIRKDRPPARKKAMPTLPIEPVGFVLPYVAPVYQPDEGQFASIVDVTGCRWPVKDDPAFVGGIACCNAAQVDGSPYCAHHKREAIASYSRTLINKTLNSVGYKKRAA